MRKAIDITGERFDQLTATRPTSRRSNRSVVWECICDCGGKTEVSINNLRRVKHTRSCGCLKKFSKGRASARAVLAKYKVEARNRNLRWALTDEEAANLFGGNCFYCDAPPANVHRPVDGNGSFTYSGIDRVDNNKGYSLENCVSCCIICNRAKQQLSVDEFCLWVRRVYDNFGKRGD